MIAFVQSHVLDSTREKGALGEKKIQVREHVEHFWYCFYWRLSRVRRPVLAVHVHSNSLPTNQLVSAAEHINVRELKIARTILGIWFDVWLYPSYIRGL